MVNLPTTKYNLQIHNCGRPFHSFSEQTTVGKLTFCVGELACPWLGMSVRCPSSTWVMAAAASEWSVVAVTRRRRDLTAVISNLISLDVTVSVSATAASYRRSTSKTRSVSTDDSGSLVSSLVALWSGSTTGTRALRTDCQSTKHSELITSENNLPMLHRISKVNTHMFDGPFSGTTRVSRYQKNKTNLDFTEETVSGSGINWAVCKSAVCTSLQDNHASTPPLSFYRAMLCIRGTSHGPVSVRLSVHPSVTSQSSTKTAKRRIT